MTVQEWFQAAKAGDCQFITDHKQEYAKTKNQEFPQATALIEAVENSQSNVAKLLIASERTMQNQFGWTALHTAIYCQNVQLCRLLANYEQNICTSKPYRDVPAGTSPLQLAFEIRNDEIVKILSSDANPAYFGQFELTAADSIGRTSLHYLALSNRVALSESDFMQMAEQLARECDGLGKTATMLAAECGNTDFLTLANTQETKMQIDSTQNEGQRGTTALMLAAQAGKTEAVCLLIPQEARMQNFEGFSALMYAAKRGLVDIIQLLKPYEAGMRTIKTVGYLTSGSSALMIAQMNGQSAAVEELLDVEKDILDDKGLSYLSVQISENAANKRNSVLSYQNVQKSNILEQSQVLNSVQLSQPLMSISQVNVSPMTSTMRELRSNQNNTQITQATQNAENDMHLAEISDLRKQITRLNSLLEQDLQNDEFISLTTNLNICITKLAKLLEKAVPEEADPQAAVETINQLVSSLESDFEVFRPEEINAIKQENKALKQKLRNSDEEIKQQKVSIEELNQKYDELDMYDKQEAEKIQDLLKNVEKLKAENCKELIEQQKEKLFCAELRGVLELEAEDDIIVEAGQLMRKLTELQEQEEELEEKLGSVEEEQSAVAQEYKDEKSQLTQQIAELTYKNEDLSQQLAEEEQLSGNERIEVQELNEKVEKLMLANSELGSQREKYIENNKIYKDTIAEVKQLLQNPHSEDIIGDLGHYIKQSELQQTELQQLADEKDSLQKELLIKRDKVEQLELQITDMKSKIDCLQSTNQKTMEQFITMSNQLKEQQSSLVKIFEEGMQ